ncbi:SMAD/FHA domain-containing protein [Mycena alexandri]|uniref:SMAD/FHA domain-containing protein n=1 Tax=Mycena alexandri TaxID=1745969 RepID=A0AAD6X3D7_9AGAR|nr:SMAD/FHA domain-containing protein [Mycena alexandri]
MLRRRRSAGNVATPTTGGGVVPPTPTPHVAPSRTHPPPSSSAGAGNATAAGGPTHRIRLVPHLDSRRSLRFDPISRDLRPVPLDPALRIGRFTDRSGLGLSAVNALNGSKIAFKSKVVSRAHAEVWCEEGACLFFIRDTKSSSGTFLNHVRLSPAGTESRPHPLKDGDILQLGVDYQGGAEDIYKSVKIRVELGREWQGRVNGFNTTALNNLKSLALGPPGANASSASAKDGGGIPDCCICLFPVSIRQALFIAPCSHAFHYKCLRPLLEAHHPAFSCPLCRTFADLEEDVEVEAEEGVRARFVSFILFSPPASFSRFLRIFDLCFFLGGVDGLLRRFPFWEFVVLASREIRVWGGFAGDACAGVCAPGGRLSSSWSSGAHPQMISGNASTGVSGVGVVSLDTVFERLVRLTCSRMEGGAQLSPAYLSVLVSEQRRGHRRTGSGGT